MSAVLTDDFSPGLYGIDWPRVLKDLYEHGVTPYRIAVLMGINQTTVQRWERLGYEPGHSYGRALLAIHAKVCGPELATSRSAITAWSYKG